MKDTINIKKIAIAVAIIVAVVIMAILVKVIINKVIINNQMKTAINAITINDKVDLYTSIKQRKKIDSLELGTNAYILENVIDKKGNQLYKVKVGKKVRLYSF